MAFGRIQTNSGTAVSSGSSCSATFLSNVSAGNLLVAIVERRSSGIPATVGQISDNQNNHWRQATEFAVNGYGVDMWICERAGGGNTPTVTAVIEGFPPSTITSMVMQLIEYSGATGWELTDQLGQSSISTSSVSVTSNYNNTQNSELAISAVVGNMTAATVPSGWSSVLADSTHKIWISDNVNGGSSGSKTTASWTGLTSGTSGVGILATFKPSGVSDNARRLIQSSYTNPNPTTLASSWTSQAYPVNPAVGNTLIAIVCCAIYGAGGGAPSGWDRSARTISVTDTAGNSWEYLADQGGDNVSGVDECLFICRSALGGPTTLTAKCDYPKMTNASVLLLEFANFPAYLALQAFASGADTSSWSLSSPRPSPPGAVAFAWMASVFTVPTGPSAGWTQVMSDTAGVGKYQVMMSTPSPSSTISYTWPGSPSGATDIALAVLGPS